MPTSSDAQIVLKDQDRFLKVGEEGSGSTYRADAMLVAINAAPRVW